MSEVRIDKWLWAVRIYKTRSIAAQACKKGRVTIDGVPIKPARIIQVGETIHVRKPPITYSFKVLQPIDKRVGAKLVPKMMKNITPPEEYEILKMNKASGFIDRNKGTGRPTKKERRQLDDFIDPFAHFENPDFDFLESFDEE